MLGRILEATRMNDEQKIKQAHEHLRSLMWDDYTERLFGVARLTSSFKTKNLNESEVEYIIDGLNHKGRFRKD
jgi:UDP-glucose 6-dehydrogenase